MGCKDNSAVDDFLGEDPNQVEVPVPLSVTITSPAADGKKVGYQE